MSCTVFALPYALAWVIGAVATSAAGAVAEAVTEAVEKQQREELLNKAYDYTLGCNNDDIHTITAEHFMEQEFETPFTDKELLVKTLEEHGVSEISASETGIFGTVEGYKLNFTRTETDKPYILKITSKTENAAEEKLNDLNSEYALNVQEDAYLHIVEKLKENNMQIEDEVVEDDNTIVLTINIDN